MSINFAGMAAGYKGFQDDQARQADESRRAADEVRRVKQDARAEQDQGFQDEQRGRVRKDWALTDKTRLDDDTDRARIEKKYAELDNPSEPVPAPPVVANTLAGQTAPSKMPPVGTAGGGMSRNKFVSAIPDDDGTLTAPQVAPAVPSFGVSNPPRSFNNILAKNREIIDGKIARNSMTMKDFYEADSMLQKIESEGMNSALSLWGQGQYQDGVNKGNSVGNYKGAKLLSGTPGVSNLPGTEGMPTHIVTMQAADGRRTVIDVANAKFQLMAQKDQLDSIRNNKKDADHASYQNRMAGVSEQNANTQEQYRLDQAENMRDRNENLRLGKGPGSGPGSGLGNSPNWDETANKRLEAQYTSKDINTNSDVIDNLGLIFAKQAAFSMSMANGGDTMVAIAQAKNFDNMLKLEAKEDPAKLQSLRQQYLAAIKPKARPPTSPQANTPGEWEQIDAGYEGKRQRRSDEQLSVLIRELKYERSSEGRNNPADIARLEREILNEQTKINSLPPASQQSKALPPAPVANPPSAKNKNPSPIKVGGINKNRSNDDPIDLRNDPVISTLVKQIKEIDGSDPANTKKIMALGTAKNTRLAQLQERYGKNTILITE